MNGCKHGCICRGSKGGYQRRNARRRSGAGVMSEINVTPLVDVMLVLLIVFMVAAPLMTVGVPIELPKTDAKPLTSQVEPLAVSIKPDGTIYLMKTAMPLDELKAKLDRRSMAPIPRRKSGCAAIWPPPMARLPKCWAPSAVPASRRSDSRPNARCRNAGGASRTDDEGQPRSITGFACGDSHRGAGGACPIMRLQEAKPVEAIMVDITSIGDVTKKMAMAKDAEKPVDKPKVEEGRSHQEAGSQGQGRQERR